MALDVVFNPVFLPILHLLGPLGFILVLCLIISFLVTLAYKLLTNQELMKSLKDDIKKHQQEMKSHKDNPKKLMEIQKKAMDKNLKYMTSSMKPSLITLLPLLLVFGWLNSHMAFEPLQPNTAFTVTAHFVDGVSGEAVLSIPEGITLLNNATQTIVDNQAVWKMKGKTGEYLLEIKHGDNSFTKDILIQKDNGYKEPIKLFKDSIIKSIEVSHEKIVVINLFGWKLGWLGCYIIFSLIFSLVLRKVMKIY